MTASAATLPDFQRARLNMVNAQLMTNGVHNPALVEAYLNLPRELLADEAQRPYVYRDEDLPLDGKRWMLEPLVEARMIQEAIREPVAKALMLGAASLPAAVMLASFVGELTVLEPDGAMIRRAKKHLEGWEAANLSLIETSYKEGYARHAPYDVIFAPGAVSGIPRILTDQLTLNGRLICVLRETMREQGRIVVTRKTRENNFETTILADAATPYLPGFEPAADFVF